MHNVEIMQAYYFLIKMAVLGVCKFHTYEICMNPPLIIGALPPRKHAQDCRLDFLSVLIKELTLASDIHKAGRR